MTRLAAIDLGTNSVRLLVAEPRGAGWQALGEAQQVTRLGEGQGRAGALGEAPMERTAAVVAAYVERAERLAADPIRIVATSAVREAPNGDAFVELVRRATGRRVEVLSGDDEARLALLGVASGLPRLAGDFVLLDIGGGSTEFVHAADSRARAVVSLRLGVVALAERAALPGLEPGRADVLVPGIAVCLAAMSRLGFASLVVSDRGLREGILCEMLAAR